MEAYLSGALSAFLALWPIYIANYHLAVGVLKT
jgi:hypothetical protein